MASRPPGERPPAFALDTLILRAAARAAEVARRQRIAFSIEAVHLAAPLTGDLAQLEVALTEWLEPAIRFNQSTHVTLGVSVAALGAGWVQARCRLTDRGLRPGTGIARGTPLPVAPATRAFTTALALDGGIPVDGPLDGRRALLVHDLADGGAALVGVLEGFGLHVDRAAPGSDATRRHAAATAVLGDGAYTFVLLAGASADGPGLATAEALTASAGARLPGFLLLGDGFDAATLRRSRALDVACVPAAPLGAEVLHGQLLRLLLDQADAPVDVAADTAGRRVLVAEDHTLSQYVAIDMLESLGLAVEVAGDGAEAVRIALEGRHDLVLMDVRMPVMDGLEATRRLRARPESAALPIIAMTANAHADGLRDCREAGMNDHLVKPVDPTALRAMLARWLPRLPAAGAAWDPPAGARPPATRLIEGIDAAAGLRFFADDPAAYRQALGRFAALYAAGLVDAAPAPADAASPDRLRRELHSLAGAATAVGATDLQRAATALETAPGAPGQRVDPAALEPLNAGLRGLAARIFDALGDGAA